MTRWRAVYDDGTYLEEDYRPGGAYAAIERHKLVKFQFYADDHALLPFWGVDVPRGSRLVYRMRSTAWGSNRVVALVAIESEDRRAVDLWTLEPTGGQVKIGRRSGYGKSPYDAPPLKPFEVAA